MTDEFIREVDEDLKEEKRLKLWKKFFPYVVSISLGIVLFTSGFVFWEGYSDNQRQKLGDDFTAAVVLAGEDDLDASLLALDRIVDKGSDGYVTMAKMKKASILIECLFKRVLTTIIIFVEKNIHKWVIYWINILSLIHI